MKKSFLMALIFILVSVLTVYADSGKKSKKVITEDVIDEVGQQYLETLNGYTKQIIKLSEEVTRKRKITEINHQYALQLYDIASKYRKSVDKKELDRVEAENKETYKDIDTKQTKIKELLQEIQKLRLDAMKYYGGKPSSLFDKRWNELKEEAESAISKNNISIEKD